MNWRNGAESGFQILMSVTGLLTSVCLTRSVRLSTELKIHIAILKADLGLALVPFDDFFRYAEKQYPQQLVVTAEGRESNLNAIQNWYALGEDIGDRADWIEEIEKRVMMDRYDNLTSEVWSLWDKHFKEKFTWPAIKENARQKWPAIVDEYEFSPADEPIEALHVQINIWTEFKAELEITIDKETTTDSDKSASDIERQNSFDFAQAKCDEAIQAYQDKQASLDLADLDWYHRDGFFDYACAEMEKQGKTLGYPSYTDSIARLSELAEIWESVTNALKHNANWVQAIVRKVESAREAEYRK